MIRAKVVSTGKYSDSGYSNEESVTHLQLTKPVEINSFLTYNYGLDDDRFPLLFATEGQGSKGVKDIEPTGSPEWTWDTMGRLKFDDYVTFFNVAANLTPGKGGAEIEVHFKTHWLIEQYGLIGPDGITQVRIQKDCGPSAYGHKYILVPVNPNPSFYIDPSLFTTGMYWSMTAPTIEQSYSKGNRSNTMAPGKMKSQLEYHRYSKEIAGPLAHIVTKYQFKNGETGGTSNLWINEEMRQFNISMRIQEEERLWIAQYNRNPDGTIKLKSRDNNKPIPHTSGMLEICSESNYDTYGEFLTLNKIKRTVGDVMNKDTDTGTMNILLMAGTGFLEDFDDAIARDAKDNGFLTPLGEKMINDKGEYLTYGRYFRQYKTPDGHIITAKACNFFDNSTIAEAAKKNGLIHPRTGRSIYSHQAAFIDFSTYQGTQNVRIVREKGNIYKAKVLKGLTDVPASWGVADSNFISTEVDMSRFEIKSSIGLQVNNANKMFLMQCVL